jgi:hypothetical protein
MAEPTDAGNDDSVARLGIGFLKSLVDSDPGAKDRGGRVPIETVGQMADIIRIGEDILGEAGFVALT